MVRNLLHAGVSPNEPDAQGWLPIDHVFRWSKSAPIELIDLLVKHGANIRQRAHGGWTPLHLAAASRDSAAYAYLVAHGADPGSKNDDGRTPRDIATIACHVWDSVRPSLIPHNKEVITVIMRTETAHP